MIPQELRVPKKLIPLILKKGNSVNSRLFIVRFWSNNEQTYRFRTIVSTKLEKKAVDRNKIRRRIYEAVNTNLKAISINGIKNPQDLILIPKKKIKYAKYKDIEDDILTLLDQWTN